MCNSIFFIDAWYESHVVSELERHRIWSYHKRSHLASLVVPLSRLFNSCPENHSRHERYEWRGKWKVIVYIFALVPHFFIRLVTSANVWKLDLFLQSYLNVYNGVSIFPYKVYFWLCFNFKNRLFFLSKKLKSLSILLIFAILI